MTVAIPLAADLAIKYGIPLLHALGGDIIALINRKHGTPAKDDPKKPEIDAAKRKELADFVTAVAQIMAGMGWIPAVPADDPRIAGATEAFYRLWKLNNGGSPALLPPGTPGDPSVKLPLPGAGFSFLVSLAPVPA